jgi:hypothetical protein
MGVPNQRSAWQRSSSLPQRSEDGVEEIGEERAIGEP